MQHTTQNSMHKKAIIFAWFYLLLAIITEVLGSSFLKLGANMQFGFVITAALICISYYFIGLAIKRISVSVAYAMWEVLGVLCIIPIGIFYFDEDLSNMQFIGIGLAILGIVLINIGEEHTHNTESLDSSLQMPTNVPNHSLAHNSSPQNNPKTTAMKIILSATLGALILLSIITLYMLFPESSALLGLLLVFGAALIDVIANLLLKASNGFRKIGYGISSIVMVVIAFYLLSLALNFMDLAVAYSSWGAIGIIGTILGGRLFFDERLNTIGYVGVVAVLSAVVLLHS